MTIPKNLPPLPHGYTQGPAAHAMMNYALRCYAAGQSALIEAMGQPCATAWMKDGKMVNAFTHAPNQQLRDAAGYFAAKGYSAMPLYALPAELAEEKL